MGIRNRILFHKCSQNSRAYNRWLARAVAPLAMTYDRENLKSSTEMTFLLVHRDAASIPLKNSTVSHGKTSCGLNGSDTEGPAGILGSPQIMNELCV